MRHGRNAETISDYVTMVTYISCIDIEINHSICCGLYRYYFILNGYRCNVVDIRFKGVIM